MAAAGRRDYLKIIRSAVIQKQGGVGLAAAGEIAQGAGKGRRIAVRPERGAGGGEFLAVIEIKRFADQQIDFPVAVDVAGRGAGAGRAGQAPFFGGVGIARSRGGQQ